MKPKLCYSIIALKIGPSAWRGFAEEPSLARLVHHHFSSYFQHFDRCAEDPDYWNNPKVLAEYRGDMNKPPRIALEAPEPRGRQS